MAWHRLTSQQQPRPFFEGGSEPPTQDSRSGVGLLTSLSSDQKLSAPAFVLHKMLQQDRYSEKEYHCNFSDDENGFLGTSGHRQIGSKSKHREMETYETNPDFACVSFLRNTKSAALGVSGFEKRNIMVPRAVSPAIRLNISFPSSGMWGVTGETGRRREQRNINICT